jgi:hypothetical protein
MYNMPITIAFFFHGNGLIIFPLFLMGKICLVYVLFGISPRIWNGIRTYTEVPLYFVVTVRNSHIFQVNKLSLKCFPKIVVLFDNINLPGRKVCYILQLTFYV